MRRAFATVATTLALAAGCLAWGALPALAASCSGASHTMTLSNGTASPGSGLAGSSFTFSVTYTDNACGAPSAISVTVPGVGTIGLVAASSTPDYQAGAVFQASTTLPAGAWTYSFSATSGTGNGLQTSTLATVSPAAVVVTVPPTPTPTPKPTPKPTPAPTPTPKATATPAPKPTPTPRPTATPTPKAAASPTPAGSPAASASSAGRLSTPTPSASRAPLAAAIVMVPGGSGPDDRGFAASVVPGGGGSDGSLLAKLLLSAVISLGGVLLFWGLMVLARRRQAPVVVIESVGAVAAVPTGPSFAETRGMVAVAPPPDTPLEEALIPRWRRPSLRAARQLSERDAPVEHLPILFQAPAPAEADRRLVAYRLVRLGSEPDEFAGEEVGRLDRGDEVEVLREETGYCLVRTPLDAVGWVHRTTLRRLDDELSYELRLETDG